MSRTLGDYNLAWQEVIDALNYQSGDACYAVLRTEPNGDVYGRGEDAITFTSDLGRAHSDAAWAGVSGKGAIVAKLDGMLHLPWERLPVVHDNDED